MALHDRLAGLPGMHDAGLPVHDPAMDPSAMYAQAPAAAPATLPVVHPAVDGGQSLAANYQAFLQRHGGGQDPLLDQGAGYMQGGGFGQGPVHRSLAQALAAVSDVARSGPHAGESFIPLSIGKTKFHVYYLPGGGRQVVRVSGPALHVPEQGHLPNTPDRLP